MFFIVEYLNADFVGLLNVAQISDKFSKVAADSFRRRFPHHQILIHHVFPLPENPNELLNVADVDIDIDTIHRLNEQLSQHFNNEAPIVIIRWSNEIYLNNGAEILGAFKHFGHVIKKIQFKIPSLNETLHSEILGKLISKYSSESLENIEFVDMEKSAENLLEHITNPLINVNTMAFNNVPLSMSPNVIRPNELFPALRTLFIKPPMNDISYFNYHIPHLEHIEIARSNREQNCSKFLDVFVKNPQIQRIHFYGVDSDFVEKLSNTSLPQFHEIGIYNWEVPNERVEFENVTTCNIGYGGIPSNLYFPRLQTLRIEYNPEHSEAYRQFLNEHNHLIHLYVKSVCNFGDWAFEHLTANITDLAELTLQEVGRGHAPRLTDSSSSVRAEPIVAFVRRQNKLKKLTVIGNDYTYKLKNQIPWNRTIHRNGVTFERE